MLVSSVNWKNLESSEKGVSGIVHIRLACGGLSSELTQPTVGGTIP